MASEAQISANQKNARKSTGPKSSKGKVIACENSIKHGLLSKALLIRNEKAEDLESFRRGIYKALSPCGALEELLTEKIINAAWRLQRLTIAECEVLNSSDFFYSTKSLQHAFRGKDGDCLQILSRYEAALERGFYKAVHELQRLQAMRLGQPVLAPIAIEVNQPREQIGFV